MQSVHPSNNAEYESIRNTGPYQQDPGTTPNIADPNAAVATTVANAEQPQLVANYGYQDSYQYYYDYFYNPVVMAAHLQQYYSELQANHPTKRKNPDDALKRNATMTDLQNVFLNLLDPALPEELRAHFQPLFCKLCNAQLNSAVNAKYHYESKNHEKKVRRWFVTSNKPLPPSLQGAGSAGNVALGTGEPPAKKSRTAVASNKDTDPRYFHCDVCDLPLTGRVHAESHYKGKQHARVLMGVSKPAGAGYYNTDGKWVRMATADVAGRGDNLGLAFAQNTHQGELAVLPAIPLDHNSLRCQVCQIAVTSLPQMEAHLKGQKHQKKMRQPISGVVRQAAVPMVPVVSTIVASGVTMSSTPVMYPQLPQLPDLAAADARETVKEDVESTTPQPDTNDVDFLSAFRTPSGLFYCKCCNLSITQELQFRCHLMSKKHLKNAKQ